MEFFKHDTDAWKDGRIMSLRCACGGAAVDAYWAIVEEIYRRETGLVFDADAAETKSVSYMLHTDADTLCGWVRSMVDLGLLFAVSDTPLTVMSARAQNQMEDMAKKAETARQNGRKGGRPTGAKTKAKPKANPGLTQGKPAGVAYKTNKTVLDTHKGYPNTAGAACAGAEKPAPPTPAFDGEECPASVAGSVASHFAALKGAMS